MLLGGSVVGRVLMPIYRDHPPAADPANFARLRKLRVAMTGGMLALLAVMGGLGHPLVGLLYDPRYAHAGAIVVAIACVQIPVVLGMTYDQSALAAGDSRNFFVVMALRAGALSGAFWAGAALAGLRGALIGQFLAATAMHLPIVWLARRHGAWDARHDLAFGLLGAGLIAGILWWNMAILGQI